MNHEKFLAQKLDLTAALAAAFESELKSLGENAKGLSWFSSSAGA